MGVRQLLSQTHSQAGYSKVAAGFRLAEPSPSGNPEHEPTAGCRWTADTAAMVRQRVFGAIHAHAQFFLLCALRLDGMSTGMTGHSRTQKLATDLSEASGIRLAPRKTGRTTLTPNRKTTATEATRPPRDRVNDQRSLAGQRGDCLLEIDPAA